VDTRHDRELLIRTINHHRHDWMNDLQVLFGYIQLNKQEKLRAYMDKLSDKLYRESLVSKLGNDRLIAYLFTFRTMGSGFELIVQPGKEIHLSEYAELGDLAADSIISILEAYRAATMQKGGDPNELTLGWDLLGEAELRIDFEYSGGYDPQGWFKGIESVLERVKKSNAGFISYDMQDRTADIELRLQIHTK